MPGGNITTHRQPKARKQKKPNLNRVAKEQGSGGPLMVLGEEAMLGGAQRRRRGWRMQHTMQSLVRLDLKLNQPQ